MYIFRKRISFCPFSMLWKSLVDRFQADSDFFPLKFFNRKFQEAIFSKTGFSPHEEVKYVALLNMDLKQLKGLFTF